MQAREGPDRVGAVSCTGPTGRSRLAVLRWVEVGAIGIGLALVTFFAGAKVDQAVARAMQLSAFDAARSATLDVASPAGADQSLWSQARIAKYQESLTQAFAPPLAVLRIPKIGLEVPVLPGTDDLTLNRAVGAIAGTALPGEVGNVGIAGHRDSFFRGLKDLESGDRLELETLAGNQEFRVTSIRIVDPSEVHVLAPTPRQVVTLVTCYPFYFVGKAPRRYIVQAEAQSSAGESEARQNR